MIHGYHVVLGAYGYWLPNDPRGSWSEFVAKWELLRFGPSTKRQPRRELCQLSAAELALREAARASLNYPPVQFSGTQARAIARGFAKACFKNGYTIWACAILPEHVHLVVARHRYKVEQVVNLLKGEATKRIVQENRHPLAQFAKQGEPPPAMWSVGQWKVYLDTADAIENAIRYVEENPEREGKPQQRWKFVTPFAGLDRGWVTYH